LRATKAWQTIRDFVGATIANPFSAGVAGDRDGAPQFRKKDVGKRMGEENLNG
jgi:hypothetical protein